MFQKIVLSALAAGIMVIASQHFVSQAGPGEAASATASSVNTTDIPPAEDSQHF
jgi:tetrahydromethanopterin S-methyltransferase subunit D